MLRRLRKTVELPPEELAEVMGEMESEERSDADGAASFGASDAAAYYDVPAGAMDDADDWEADDAAYYDVPAGATDDAEYREAADANAANVNDYISGRNLYGDEVEREARAYLMSGPDRSYDRHTGTWRMSDEEAAEIHEREAFAEGFGDSTEDRAGFDRTMHPAYRMRRSEAIEAKNAPAKPRKPHKKKHYFLKFLVLVAILAGTGAFLLSDFFAVKTITVKGIVNYTAEEVVELSGLKEGTNIFKMKKGAIRDKLLGDSYIDNVQIKRELPGTVVITIEERTELAAVKKGDKYLIIDREGYLLRESEKMPQLTEITEVHITEAEKGHQVTAKEKDIFTETLGLLNAMQYSDLFFKKVEVKEHSIRVFVYDRLVVKGTPEDMLTNIKNGNLEKILYDLTEKDITKGTITVGKNDYFSFSPEIE